MDTWELICTFFKVQLTETSTVPQIELSIDWLPLAFFTPCSAWNMVYETYLILLTLKSRFSSTPLEERAALSMAVTYRSKQKTHAWWGQNVKKKRCHHVLFKLSPDLCAVMLPCVYMHVCVCTRVRMRAHAHMCCIDIFGQVIRNTSNKPCPPHLLSYSALFFLHTDCFQGHTWYVLILTFFCFVHIRLDILRSLTAWFICCKDTCFTFPVILCMILLFRVLVMDLKKT